MYLDILPVNSDSSEGKCGYQDVLNYLNLTKNNDLYTMARPVINYTTTTNVYLQMLVHSILDVKETDQTFVPYIWIYMAWQNEHIYWKPEDFCGLSSMSVPIDRLWRPDITIEEMTEMDKAPPSPYIRIFWNGWVVRLNDMVLVSTCKMQVYKFPFDIQSCNISFKSAIHHVSQISMKRRSLLYVVNFLLPVLFFLCLDLSSFLISDRGGEKLSFKVTVLLAVTVLQLILNEILPSSSNRIPLIATYCIGSFALMMLSLLETILVMHLMEKDSASQDEANKDQSLSEDCGDKRGKVTFHNCCRGEIKKWTHCVSVCDVSTGETPSGLLSVAKEVRIN
ncbi:5-hydroxytryptamine receptor 3A-like [Micropterus salmoides]|uniref:5-hydroxytryptamine receptor 3A-like n=1 Tax=Micropterus salmoides TaxID=27706 RepID=UPI0018EC4CFA|nr:5-hydroxytryptamine receptor 3A-like [Micropterus salmoides]